MFVKPLSKHVDLEENNFSRLLINVLLSVQVALLLRSRLARDAIIVLIVFLTRSIVAIQKFPICKFCFKFLLSSILSLSLFPPPFFPLFSFLPFSPSPSFPPSPSLPLHPGEIYARVFLDRGHREKETWHVRHSMLQVRSYRFGKELAYPGT